ATALHAAAAGARTLVVSTDAAHSLGDSFGRAVASTPTELAPHLFAQQLDASERFEEAWGDVQGYLVEVMGWAGVDSVEAEELAVLPGLDELFSLTAILGHAASGEWDAIVVDCAPTAETIRLLSLPDVLGWYMAKVFPATRRVARLARPLLSAMGGVPPVAGDQVFAALERLVDQLAGVRQLLADTSTTSLRLVVNPERMVVAEARRTATYMALFGYRVDAVVANRLLPEAVTDPWFKAWRESHAEHLATIVEGFAPLPVLRADLASDEVVGAARLAALATELYGVDDPLAVLHEGQPMSVRRRGERSVLVLPLPFCEHHELEVGRRDDDLLVRVGPYRRAVHLPDSLQRRVVAGAALRDGGLEVEFAEGDR
ncbi:MAG: ArsA family ATPase, partial [Acidimicrobiales bacterium]